ncbi:MAG: PAS domain S-box protein [Bdellovibrionaceae bacterium]|nr:PAS domain S-box protein [Bdellovibrio sp.]
MEIQPESASFNKFTQPVQSQSTVAGLLRFKKREILLRWKERVSNVVVNIQDESTPHLIDTVPELLDRLQNLLSAPAPYEMQVKNTARISVEHTEVRITQDFNLDEVLREYQILRQVILETLENDEPLSKECRDLILDVIQNSMNYAVAHFANVQRRKNLTPWKPAINDLVGTPYLISIFSVVFVTLLQFSFWDYLQPLQYILFYPAVIFSSIYGSGWLATVLAATVAEYFFSGPKFAFSIDTTNGWISLIAFLLSGASINFVAQRLRWARSTAVHERERWMAIAEHQNTLAEIGRLAVSFVERQDLFDEGCERIAKALKCEVAKIYEYIPQKNSFELRACFGCTEEALDPLFRVSDKDQVEHTVKTKMGLVMKDYSQDLRFGKPMPVNGKPILSGMTAFISGGPVAFGVLVVQSSHLRNFTDDDKNFITSAGNTLANVIERRNSEESLKKSESKNRHLAEEMQRQARKFDAMLAGVPDLVYLFDTEHRLAYANPALLTLWGMNLADAVGKTFVELGYPPELNQQHTLDVNNALAGHKVRNESTFKGMDGAIINFEYSFAPVFDENNTIIAVSGVSRDITERKRTEEAIKNLNADLNQSNLNLVGDKDELSRSNAELGRFAAIAAHDLKSPLNSISQFLDLVDEEYGHKLDGNVKEYFGYITKAADRMRKLIDRLLTFARVGAKDEPFKPVCCHTLLDSVRMTLKSAIDQNRARLTYDHLPVVQGDETELYQLFQNLVGNAIKFRGHQEPQIHIAAEERECHWQFSVKDNGIGIDVNDAKHIFEPFKRLRSNEFEGTGLGLAIVNKIVEHHQGQIWLESEPNQGSTFYFTIQK